MTVASPNASVRALAERLWIYRGALEKLSRSGS